MASFNPPGDHSLKIRGRYVPYFRISDRPYSELKLKRQQLAIEEVLERGPSTLLEGFEEHEPLASGDRPELKKAAAFCKAENATLIFGQLDRMRSSMRWLEYLHQEKVKFLGADNPQINQRSFFVFKQANTDWRNMMSESVSQAMSAAKAQGATFGGKRENCEGLKLGPAASAAWRQDLVRSDNLETMKKIVWLRDRNNTSLTEIAKRLNLMEHPAPRGGKWSPTQVRRIIKKFDG